MNRRRAEWRRSQKIKTRRNINHPNKNAPTRLCWGVLAFQSNSTRRHRRLRRIFDIACAVVVNDCPASCGDSQSGADRIGQRDGKRFVAFDKGIGQHSNAHIGDGASGAKCQRAGARCVIASGEGASVHGLEIDCDCLRRGPRQRHVERDVRRTRMTFDHRNT